MVRVIVKSHQGMLFGLPQDAWKEELLNAVPLDELEKEGILIPKDFNGIAVLTAEALEIVRKKNPEVIQSWKIKLVMELGFSPPKYLFFASGTFL